MADKILIVDDDATNLRFLKLVLASDGFDVRAASRAGEAFAIIHGFHPGLILMGTALADTSGLDFLRQLKASAQTSRIPVALVTASTAVGVEQEAREAGCEGFIAKPVDVRLLRAMVRQLTAAAAPESEFAEEMGEIRHAFAAEGLANVRSLLQTLDLAAKAETLHRLAHNWKGAGSSVGAPRVSDLARELELAGTGQIPALLEALAREFETLTGHGGPPPIALPGAVHTALGGKRIGLLGFGEDDEARLRRILESAGAFCRVLDFVAIAPGSPETAQFDLLMLNVCPETASTPWLDAEGVARNLLPLILAGSPETLFAEGSQPGTGTADFMAEPWSDLEAASRAQRAITGTGFVGAVRPARKSAPRIVLADDDATVRALLNATLSSCGMQCQAAVDGRQALEIIRRELPDAAILDVNMPGADGFEVLSALKADPATKGVRVILLTARQQETDVLRGFSLGADDYLVKPFSPMELSARLERVLAR